MKHYLDANFILSIFLLDSHSTRAFTWLGVQKRKAVVSIWTETEVAVVLRRYVRTGRLSVAALDKFLRDIEDWTLHNASRLDLSPVAGQIALSLGKDESMKLSAQDALHLGLAISANAILVTFDNRLADAARLMGHSVVVP